ncbi:hypothetical protein BCEN4_740004 [Burkholderia cenocepacia]|nr:hypothetical protein BCEN4_740004 [Burkholderia cenocepacia]
MPSVFSTPSVDSGWPLPDIGRPEYAVHADDDATVFTGLALQAILSAGVLAKAGAASISAKMEIGIRKVGFIGGPSVSSCCLYEKRARYYTRPIVRTRSGCLARKPASTKKRCGQPTGSAFSRTALTGYVQLLVREAGLEPAHPCGRQDLNPKTQQFAHRSKLLILLSFWVVEPLAKEGFPNSFPNCTILPTASTPTEGDMPRHRRHAWDQSSKGRNYTKEKPLWLTLRTARLGL